MLLKDQIIKKDPLILNSRFAENQLNIQIDIKRSKQIKKIMKQSQIFQSMIIIKSLSGRFKRIEQVVTCNLENHYFRMLKQQEKIRCEKQNFLINIMKASKNLNNEQKIDYYFKSIDIMKIINKYFQYKQMTHQQILDNFLDSFVGLYKTFFDYFQQSMQFKTHIKNFLRPTNHNVINDLIKYLIDFSRDYYQQTFIWYHRQKKKDQQYKFNKLIFDQRNRKLKPVIENNQNYSDLNPISITTQIKTQTHPLTATIQIKKKKESSQLVNKNYEILNIISSPSINNFDKSMNMEIIKLKINQIFRDMKMRNFLSKTTCEKYRQRYNLKFFQKVQDYEVLKYTFKQETNDFPYRLFLSIQKNGYSCIGIEQKKKGYKISSPLKKSQKQIQEYNEDGIYPNQLINLNNSETVIKNRGSDYLLNSLKILRVTQNFLPPLIFSKQTQRTQKKIEQFLIEISTEQKQIKEIKQIKLIKKQKQILRYFNGQVQQQQVKLRLDKNRLKSIKKNFNPEENKKKQVDSSYDDRLGQWLDKIKNLNDIQKKKLMGFE